MFPRERTLVIVRLAFFVAGLSAAGLLCTALSERLPSAIAGTGLSPLTIALQSVAAILLLTAVVTFLDDYLRGGGTALFMLSLALILLCESTGMLWFARRMDATWWFAHAVRLTAYLLLLVGLALAFVNMSARLSRVAVELKQAESVAVREQGALRSVFDSIADEMFVIDTNFVIQTVNAEMVRKHGDAALPGFQLIGRRCFEVYHGRDTACPDCPIQEMFLTGLPVHGRTKKLATRSGKAYTGDISSGPIRDFAGLAVGAVVIVRDVTERENGLETMRRERDFINRIVQTADALIVGLDLQGNITLFNRKCADLTGYASTEVIGRPLWERLIPERFIEPVKQVFARLKADVLPSEFENPWLTRSGEERWIAWHNTNIKDAAGNVTSIIAMGVDVTERKKAEESVHFLSSLLEQSTQPLRVTTFEGDLVRFNRAFQELTGYTAMGLQRTNCRDLTPPHWHKIEEEKRAEVVRTGRPLTYEQEILRKDGRHIPVEVVTDVYRDERGIPGYLYSFIRDISDRKRAEEERRRLQEQLLQVQKMNALGTLAGGIAHEFNNLLGAILGYSSLLKTKTDAEHPFYKAIDTIEKSSQRGAELTRQIMSFARVGKYKIGPTDLNAVVTRVLGLVSQTFGPNCRIETRFHEGLWPVQGDSAQLVHALINLCINAREAMPDGGRLVIETQNVPDADASVRGCVEAQPGPYVLVSIADTGVGMSPEMQQRIFEPFFTTKEDGKGTGMGLAVVYGVVKGHGGFITVSSEPGSGSCFSLFLPAAPALAQVPREEAPSPLPRGAETILLAEDDAVVRAAAADMLGELGYTVIEAADGRQALERYAQHRDEIGLVLLDMVMPELSGRDVSRALRQMNPQVIILLSSGYDDAEQVKDLLGQEAQGFIAKPFQIEELAKMVRGLLDKAS
jgi:PAS domain S-box-containing protein